MFYSRADDLFKIEQKVPYAADYDTCIAQAKKDLRAKCPVGGSRCPAGIDIGLVNKYYDLALAGDSMAASHYGKLTVKADACIGCGHCDKRCPFHTAQSARIKEIAAYFGN